MARTRKRAPFCEPTVSSINRFEDSVYGIPVKVVSEVVFDTVDPPLRAVIKSDEPTSFTGPKTKPLAVIPDAHGIVGIDWPLSPSG